jgi:hypothetical protein
MQRLGGSSWRFGLFPAFVYQINMKSPLPEMDSLGHPSPKLVKLLCIGPPLLHPTEDFISDGVPSEFLASVAEFQESFSCLEHVSLESSLGLSTKRNMGKCDFSPSRILS